MGCITFEYQYMVDEYIVFNKTIVSGEFSGSSTFCLSKDSLKEAILSLDEMNSRLSGTYQINDYDSNDFVLFEFLKHGHVKISGQVGGTHNRQYLVYEFSTDQTLLGEVILSLSHLSNS